MRGEIVALYSLYCGRCDVDPLQAQGARDKAEAAKFGREQGWQYTSKDGWICYECVQEKRKSR